MGTAVQLKKQYDKYKNYKNSVNKSQSTYFLKFLSWYLIEKKIINCSNNLINVDIHFTQTLRDTCIIKINQDATENPAVENKTLQPDTREQFFSCKIFCPLEIQYCINWPSTHPMKHSRSEEWQRAHAILRQKVIKNV